MDTKAKKLTNEVGAPVAENEHSLTAGPRGPVMMQDVWLLEKLAHFDREVIPERRMHAKGWGVFKFIYQHYDDGRSSLPNQGRCQFGKTVKSRFYQCRCSNQNGKKQSTDGGDRSGGLRVCGRDAFDMDIEMA